jgi:hypothetical protein
LKDYREGTSPRSVRNSTGTAYPSLSSRATTARPSIPSADISNNHNYGAAVWGNTPSPVTSESEETRIRELALFYTLKLLEGKVITLDTFSTYLDDVHGWLRFGTSIK